MNVIDVHAYTSFRIIQDLDLPVAKALFGICLPANTWRAARTTASLAMETAFRERLVATGVELFRRVLFCGRGR